MTGILGPLRRMRRLVGAAARLTIAAVLLSGPPYLLARFVGWPLPTHPPTWPRLRVFLTSPLGDDTIIKVLACIVWLLWAILALSVLIEVVAAVRGRAAPRLPVIAPVQALAAALIGATMLTSAPLARAVPRPLALQHALVTHAVATAPPSPAQAEPGPGSAEAVVMTALDALPSAASSTLSSQVPRRPRIHRVVEGDNLWDIAARYLGDGELWPEIYDLNAGKPQPDGQALTDPDLIYPGWVLLLPPAHGHQGGASPGGHPRHGHPGHPRPVPSSPSPSPSATRPTRPTPGASASLPGAHAHPPSAGVRLPSGALIGLGTAAAVSAALALARIHRRRRYRPEPTFASSTEPTEPPPPLISVLDRAGCSLSSAPDRESDLDLEKDDDADLDLYEPSGTPSSPPASAGPSAGLALAVPELVPGRLPTRHGDPAAPEAVPPLGSQIPLGVRNGQEITVDIAAVGGLGLTGPGAPSAARAVLAHLISRSLSARDETSARIIIPAADARQLLPGPGREEAHLPVPGLSVPPTLTRFNE